MVECDSAYWHEGHDDYDLEKTTALQEAGWEAKDICGNIGSQRRYRLPHDFSAESQGFQGFDLEKTRESHRLPR